METCEGVDNLSNRVGAINVDGGSKSTKILHLLRRFLCIQQRRAEAYAKLRSGFSQYMASGGELAYQQLCGEITGEFNDCSKQVLEMESLLLMPDLCRGDLAELLKAIQAQEKQKLHLMRQVKISRKIQSAYALLLIWDQGNIDCISFASKLLKLFMMCTLPNPKLIKTVKMQILKKAGRPSERPVSHDSCRFSKPMEHECVHVHELTEASGTEDAEADAEHDGALKEAIRGVQVAVTSINEHLEEVRYEIEALASEQQAN